MAILRTGQIKPNPIDWILALNPFICAMLAFGSLTFAPIQPKNHLFSANLEKWAKIKAQQNHDNNDESRTNSRKKRINDEHQSRLSPSARSNAKYAENVFPFLKKYYSKPFSRSASYAKFQAMTLFPNNTAEIDDIFLKQKKHKIFNRIFGRKRHCFDRLWLTEPDAIASFTVAFHLFNGPFVCTAQIPTQKNLQRHVTLCFCYLLLLRVRARILVSFQFTIDFEANADHLHFSFEFSIPSKIGRCSSLSSKMQCVPKKQKYANRRRNPNEMRKVHPFSS